MATKASKPAPTTSFDRTLVLGAIAGPILFNLAWIILGPLSTGYTLFGTRIEPYNAIAQPVSGLGLGVTGPYMNAAFIISGLLLILGSIGIGRALRGLVSTPVRIAIAAMLMVPGLACINDGIFTLEYFFPHFLGFGLVLTTIVTYPIIGWLLRRVPGWSALSKGLLAAGPLTLILTIWYFSTFTPTVEGARTGIAGLTERVLIVEILVWYVALGLMAMSGKKAARTRKRA